MALSYRTAQLQLGAADPAATRALQQDLRVLGYLGAGIDGQFGAGTDRAVRRLKYDLLNNDGASTAGDGTAPVSVRSYNRARVTERNGVVDPGLADCIEDLLNDAAMPKLPSAADPTAANQAAIVAIAATSGSAPAPFLLAIFAQESGSQHYCVPSPRNSDSFVTVGLDYNPADPDHVTSRGYGLGQYTIFHHPPRPAEIADFIVDPVGNVKKAFGELRDKFDHFVLGGTSATTADDRVAEHPLLPLRVCRYAPGDARYLRDCRNCALAARKIDIGPNTPVYDGAADRYGAAPHYQNVDYRGVPDRADIQCDWPYAARRYNGSGPDSYNYQARILRNLLSVPDTVQAASAPASNG